MALEKGTAVVWTTTYISGFLPSTTNNAKSIWNLFVTICSVFSHEDDSNIFGMFF